MKNPLQLTIGRNVFEHLGLNLYSNVPAVLSEVVANAWDADARNVTVDINSTESCITIRDDGCGMTRDDVNDRFLFIGYKRRKKEALRTPVLNRLPMGRKGIGKLASFSIADKVTVFAVKDGQRTAARLDVIKIRERLQENEREQSIFVEEVLDEWPSDLTEGTCVVLSQVHKRLTALTESGLRQRISRRFSIIGPSNDFNVCVNGVPVTPKDRGYLERLEYLWVYGNHEDIVQSCQGLRDGRDPVDRSNGIHEERDGTRITGWIGTVCNPNSLKSGTNENMNNLAVFMRGKLCHEDLINDLGIKEIYANYLVGEIYCDDLDKDDAEDITTSNRQSLKRDDPRFEAIVKLLRKELRHISKTWSEWRREDGSKVLAKEVPAIEKWLDSLEGDVKKKATRWIGRLNNIQVDNSRDRLELMKASVLAFENYSRRSQVDLLDSLVDEDIEPILKVFDNIDSLELSYYGQIVKFRLDVISKMEELIAENVRENEVRDYLYKHLWLLDPTWERARGTEVVEKSIQKFLQEDSSSLSPEERRGRIDIGYRKTVGSHVIVELKRADVRVSVLDLINQIDKYRSAVLKLLKDSTQPDWPLEIIVLLGRQPREFETVEGAETARRLLDAYHMRIVYYNQLLSSARGAYQDYLDKHKEIDRLWQIFAEIDDFSETSDRASSSR